MSLTNPALVKLGLPLRDRNRDKPSTAPRVTEPYLRSKSKSKRRLRQGGTRSRPPHFALGATARWLHFFQVASSVSALMKTPPTTERA
jgi:hypothetical protein